MTLCQNNSNQRPKESPRASIKSECSFKETAKKMDGNSSVGSTPKMDWCSGDLPSAWKAFKQHCEFTFGGPPKAKTENEEVKCNYIVLLAGDKGREC